MSGFTKEQSERARNADLSEFVLRTDPDHYKIQGNSVRLYDPTANPKDRIKSISIKRGASWAYDFKEQRAINAVQYLTEYMGYPLVDAVKALAGDEVTYQPAQQQSTRNDGKSDKPPIPPKFPEKLDGRPRQMYAYLCKRGIPAETITELCKLGLLYQSKQHNNIVFINGRRDYAELRGTYTFGEPFHGVVKNRPDRCWSFAIGKPERAYVCEAAIDAISLYLLKQREGTADGALYVSIGGVSNQKTIDLVKKYLPVVIAVDNDRAGQMCRNRNPDCEFILPTAKDWNEDLLQGNQIRSNENALDSVLSDTESKAAVQQRAQGCVDRHLDERSER